MKYPYLVVKDGIEYPAGTDVPEENIPAAETEPEPEKSVYKKNDINRMPVSELKELAANNGIDIEEKSGADLKKALIEKFGL